MTGATGATGATGTLGSLAYFDTTHSPVALWNFNETLDDASGNNLHLSAQTGSATYCDITPGKKGLYVLPGTRFGRATDALLRITGDMTIQAILQMDVAPSSAFPSTTVIVRHSGSGELEVNNVLYSLELVSTSGLPPTFPRYLAENGAGSDTIFEPSGVTLPPIHNIVYLAMRRQSGVIQMFVNGVPFGGNSSALTAPTGGGSGGITVGSPFNTNVTERIVIMSVKIVASALTNSQIKGEYNRTMGVAFGPLA